MILNIIVLLYALSSTILWNLEKNMAVDEKIKERTVGPLLIDSLFVLITVHGYMSLLQWAL
jgi:hypothetical protein